MKCPSDTFRISLLELKTLSLGEDSGFPRPISRYTFLHIACQLTSSLHSRVIFVTSRATRGRGRRLSGQPDNHFYRTNVFPGVITSFTLAPMGRFRSLRSEVACQNSQTADTANLPGRRRLPTFMKRQPRRASNLGACLESGLTIAQNNETEAERDQLAANCCLRCQVSVRILATPLRRISNHSSRDEQDVRCQQPITCLNRKKSQGVRSLK
jgi:hypothetical protein